ncbi:hypothetical protein P7H91_13205 [Lactococcus lactis]|uniref:hypothetical protein n=1 Tax=Lactococcus lactis TaxID=1358 RepID=UPI0028900EA5|nr:hypothetical protein [Lactococcus lactis]MDT2914789.1 hypothetical protein [Lactococcus lactis]
MKKIGFLFGAGAEISYGMPSGGKFALDIFRHSTESSKENLRKMRSKINTSSAYATNWLPEDFESKNISSFGQRVFDSIIKSTIGNNREDIIHKLGDFDELAVSAINKVYGDYKSYTKNVVDDLSTPFKDINISQRISYNPIFNEGDTLFKSRTFSVLLTYYSQYEFEKEDEKLLFKNIIVSIFQLQLGALSENVSRNIEESLFKKNNLHLDFFDDLGGTINVNYDMAGISGLKLLAEKDFSSIDHQIVKLAYAILENIYADILDYKSLIDSNWHYLYNPKNEWAKFSKIVVFLYTVRDYIIEKAQSLDEHNDGYYNDIKKIEADGLFNITTIGTTNYSPFIEKIIEHDIKFLNGGTNIYYDPYLNSIVLDDKSNDHFIVPLLFTQSGTKPMTSIDMSEKYVDFYHDLCNSDVIIVIGFGFNSDDEHINGIFRQLINKHDKTIYIVDTDNSSEMNKKNKIQAKLKTETTDNINFITINPEDRTADNEIWYKKIN